MKNMLQLAHVMLGKKKMLQLTHLICIIRSTRYLDDKTCHFFLTNPCHKIYWQMSRDEMAKELHGYVMTCIEGYIKKSFLFQFNGRHIMQKKKRYMQSAGYVTCMERINNVSWLNLMAGTAHGKNRNLRSQLIMHAT